MVSYRSSSQREMIKTILPPQELKAIKKELYWSLWWGFVAIGFEFMLYWKWH